MKTQERRGFVQIGYRVPEAVPGVKRAQCLCAKASVLEGLTGTPDQKHAGSSP